MNRRDALKNLSLSLGYAVAAPTIMNLFASCTAEADGWTPLFLSEEEKHVVTHLVDIILPSSETPGALDVNIPQFLDLMYHDIELETNKKTFSRGARIFSDKFLKTNEKAVSKGNKDEFEKLISKYFNVSDEDSKAIFNLQNKNINNIQHKDLENYTLYKFLLSVRYYTIFGYCTSEKVGEEVLAYDPVPGAYNGCVSLEETTQGRAWSI